MTSLYLKTKFLLIKFEFTSTTKIAVLMAGIALLGNITARLSQAHASETDKADPKIALVSTNSSANDRPVINGDDILIDGIVESGDLANGFTIKTISFKNSSGRVGDISGKEKAVSILSDAKWFRLNGEKVESVQPPSATFNFQDIRIQVIGENGSGGLNAKYVILPENTSAKVLLAVSPPVKETTPKQATDVQPPKPVSELDHLVLSQFSLFGSAIGISSAELENPQIENHGNFIQAATSKWIYRIDAAGLQTFKPVSNLSAINSSINDTPQKDVNLEQLTYDAKGIASSLGLDKDARLTMFIVRKEKILVGQCGNLDSVRTTDGRYLVKWRDKNNLNYCFQVIFDPNLSPVRIDTNVTTPTSQQVAQTLRVNLANGADAISLKAQAKDMGITTFFDPSEYRFELGALSVEGFDFQDLHTLKNPFQHDNFEAAPYLLTNTKGHNIPERTDLVDVAAWLRTEDGKFWQYHGWDKTGRMGGIRGSWDSSKQVWQRNVPILHKNLGDYTLLAGEPSETKDFTLTDGKVHAFPAASSQQLDQRYYKDRESNTVAAFYSHGGAIGDVFQLRRGLDVWFIPGDIEHPYGSGALRSVFFGSCDSMGYSNVDPNVKHLLEDWFLAKNIKGLRTASGYDGTASGSGDVVRDFFAMYNKGDSISDAWLVSAMIYQDDWNVPVTISYGSSLEEAVTTYSDGRLQKDRVSPNYVVAGVWTKTEIGR